TTSTWLQDHTTVVLALSGIAVLVATAGAVGHRLGATRRDTAAKTVGPENNSLQDSPTSATAGTQARTPGH
ncbi:hypothetical protein V5264_31930, partial [Pseudomonas citronellolis]